MLNIANFKSKTKKPYISNSEGEKFYEIKHYPSATKEWFNSIYAYNKNTSKLLPVADSVLLKLIKSYFNLFNTNLENSIKRRRLLRLRKRVSSTNRIFVSRGELKHTSDKIVIMFYVYNRQNNNFMKKINKTVYNIYDEKLPFLKKIKLLLDKTLKIALIGIEKDSLVFNAIKKPYLTKYKFENIENKYINNFIGKFLKKEMLYIAYTRLLCFNKSKFNSTYVFPITNLISKLYNKKVEFNFINLKYLHLNSDIFTEVISLKLRNRKNRLLRVIRASFSHVKRPKIRKFQLVGNKKNRNKYLQNPKVNDLALKPNYIKLNPNKSDTLNKIMLKLFKCHNDYSNILNNLKHKSTSGIRIEASGRLTKRITAARSLFKVKYIGNLRNVDSSFKGYPSVILRGNLKSNLQYTKIKSKTRIGSFGLKTWISSY